MKTLIILLLLTTLNSHAQLKIPQIFSDGMVLQRNTSAKIWGWTKPNTKVAISFIGQDHIAHSDQDGHWEYHFKGLKTKRSGSALTIESAGTKKVIKNVLVGEVWIASGQSNMEQKVSQALRGKEEIATAQDPLLRVFVSANTAAASPQKDWEGQWKSTQSTHTATFTAVGYYFAKELRSALNVPVGIIECAWGAKPIQAFTSEKALSTLPAGKTLLQKKAEAAAAYQPETANTRYQKQLTEYKEKLTAWKQHQKGRKPRKPRSPLHPNEDPSMPSVIYNGMIAPCVGYGSRGAIWYQGEANANDGTAKHYEELLGCLVSDWRQRWGQQLSFYWVQLANFRKPVTKAGTESEWALVQDEMRRALKSIPKSGMAVANDIGEAKDIHPKNKQDVGKRLARWALVQDYGKKNIIVSGPLYSGMKKEKHQIIISFRHAQGLKTRDGKSPQHFEIAGADGIWHWAKANIVDDKIILSHPEIKNPIKARYAWASNPQGSNLVNSINLPTSCFTTE